LRAPGFPKAARRTPRRLSPVAGLHHAHSQTWRSANLARDLRATGDRDAAAELEAQTLASLDDVLTPEHPISMRARQKGRIDLDIIPATLLIHQAVG
jgi:hypothetical protein